MVFFDTSVLVTAVVTELPNHDRAHDCLVKHIQNHDGACISNHVLAEAYATLTALPVKKRISPMDAKSIIEESFVNKLQVVPLSTEVYLSAIRKVSNQGLGSGIIYDALHLEIAESMGCTELITYNLQDFKRLEPQNIRVLSP
jgi:predicted nucleic acid-binding protein